VHVGQVIERFLLDAQIFELLGPGHRVIGVSLASESSENQSHGEGSGELGAHGISLERELRGGELRIAEQRAGSVTHCEIVRKHEQSALENTNGRLSRESRPAVFVLVRWDER